MSAIGFRAARAGSGRHRRGGALRIQMARLLDARQVLTTVSGMKKALLAQEAGADVVINYHTEDVVARIMEETDGDGVDRIVEVDFGANIQTSLKVLKLDSLIVTYGNTAAEIKAPFYPLVLKNVGLNFLILYKLSNEARKSAISKLMEMLGEGHLKHNIAATFTLDETAAAHEWVEQAMGAGNVLINTRESET